MSIRTKGRRKILVGGRKYIWYVGFEDPGYDHLNVVSDDKYLILSCPLRTGKRPYVISKGRIFQTRRTSGHWERYLLPFDVPDAITPKFVEELIGWAVEGTEATPVNAGSVPV